MTGTPTHPNRVCASSPDQRLEVSMESRGGVLLAAVAASIVTALVVGGLTWATI